VDNPLLITSYKAYSGKYLYLLFVILLGISVGGCGSGSNGSTDDNQRCRLYATQYAASGEGITNGYSSLSTPITVNCAFDAGSLLLTCSAQYTDQYGSSALITKSRGYASISDFVEEASNVGKTLAVSYKFSNDGFSPDSIIHQLFGDGTNVFDSGKKLLSTDNVRLNRGTSRGGRLNRSPPASVQAITHPFRIQRPGEDRGDAFQHTDIDTAGRRYNPCIPITTLIKFDSQGNVVRLTLPSGTTNYSIVKTEAVCVNE